MVRFHVTDIIFNQENAMHKEKILKLISEQLAAKPEQLEGNPLLVVMGMDSLDLVELIISVEDEFDIQIDESKLASDALRVDEFVAVVEQSIAAA